MKPSFDPTQSDVARNRFVIFLLWIVFYASFTLLAPPLLDDADSVHAEVAREMLLRHDWVTLYANGIRYLEKAPLLYWSVATSFKLFGAHTAAARLPLALTVLALALALEGFARRAFGSPGNEESGIRAGLYAAILLLSSFGIFIFTRITIPDADVCLWLTLALYAYWLTEQHQAQPSRLLCYAFATCCALNVLTKGLIGLVFPIGIVLVHLLLTRGVQGTLQRLRQLSPITSTIVFLVIAAPWHILVGLANPTEGHPAPITFSNHHWNVPLPTDGNVHGWSWFYFVNEHLLRYLNLRVPRDYDTVPLILFWGLLLVWIMPWSAYLYHAFAAVEYRAIVIASPLFRKLKWLQTRLNPNNDEASLTPEENTRLLLAIWAAVPLLFFSLSTRQEYYVLPAIPALLLLIAAWLNDEVAEAASFAIPNPHVVAGQRISVVLLLLGSLAALAAGFFVVHSHPPGPNTDLAALLQQNPGDYALSFGHFLDLNAQAMGAFRTPLIITAVALFGGALINWLLRRDYRPHTANLWLAAATFAFLAAAHLGLQIFSPVLTSRQLADQLVPLIQPDDLIVINGEYEAASTLGFYLSRPSPDTKPLHILNGRSSNLWYGSFFSDAPPIFEDEISLSLKWTGVRRIFLWQDLADPGHPLPKLPGKIYFIAQGGGKEIVSNQPNPY
jgi:4-amino-4-deoxy-L-arabinose transferase-like glycosyltransferase